VFRFSNLDYDGGIEREWLVANGLGGYASSTVIGANSRKYHGLLIAALNPPVGRRVLLSNLDETLCVEGECFELSVHKYPNTVHPKGFEYLKFYEMEVFPCFIYEAGGVRVEKTVFMQHKRNAVFVEYHINPQGASCEIVLRPLMTNRDFHAIRRRQDSFECRLEGDVCCVVDDSRSVLFLASDKAQFVESENWYYNVEYDVERLRGQDYQEDLYSPGYFVYPLEEETSLCIAASSPHYGFDASLRQVCLNWQVIKEQELLRRQNLIKRAGIRDSFARALALAADSFIVSRGEQRSIIAGYHWFSDWGRDTMISLCGLTLATRRFDDARSILGVFADNAKQGLIPNRFTETGGKEYNTADAPLWFIHACFKYLEYTGDEDFVKRRLWPRIQSIISHYRGGTDGVFVDSDGLVVSAPRMTWMDAKVGDWIVTPRAGKACEINALWYNALRIAAGIANRFDEDDTVYCELAEVVEESYERFWNPQQQCLFDTLDPVDGSIRPNQIFAVALPYRVVSKRYAEKILETVERVLLTPFGLRTLSPSHPDYKPRYGGDTVSRDAAYHQGTVWPWLLGGYITAYLNVHGRSEKNRRHVRRLLASLEEHLSAAGLGGISEVFDAELPHTPGGCILQAWSVAEILRCMVEDLTIK
jgi:predicted glycogen debranching enzyme